MRHEPASEALDRAVELLACMAHPARLGVLVHLHRCGPASVGDLQTAVGIEQSALSHHLRKLRQAGLIHSERRGKHVVNELADAHVGSIVEDTLAHADELVGR